MCDAAGDLVHRRNFAQIFPRRMGCWYMDLGNTGWMQDKALWENIGECESSGRITWRILYASRQKLPVVADR